MNAALALLLLLSVAIEVSPKFEVIPEPQEFKGLETTSTGVVTRCNLWSRVRYVSDNNQSLVNLPYVHWEKANKNSDDFHPLRDVYYWYYKERLSFMRSVRYYCTRLQEDSNVYDCGLTIERCSLNYVGTYRYSVYDFDSGSQVEQIVRLKQPKDSLSSCYMPQAENISVEFIAGVAGGAHMINVSWEYTNKPKGDSYCHFSRQWQIRSFNSSSPDQFEDGKEPSLFRDFEFFNTTTRRDTFFVFRINESLRNNYFQFQIQNRKLKGDTGILIARKYNSSIFTFREQEPASLTMPQVNAELVTVSVGERLTLRCEATGIPTPTVLLLKGIIDSSWRSQDYGEGTAIRRERTFDPVQKEDEGLYVCLASNTLVGPPGGKRKVTDWKTINVKVTEVDRTDVSETIHCDTYSGSICSGFIRDSISVYIDGISIRGNYSTLLTRAASLITNIRGAYSAKSDTTTDLDLLTKCKELAEGVACHTVFPYCSPQEGHENPTARPICKSTCDAFRAGGACEGFINSQMSPDFYHSLMSNCDERDYPAGSSPECIPVPLQPREIETEEIHWCLSGNGRDYNNYKRRTESGLDCQNWYSQAPHRHPFTLSDYPELMNAAAYCRNPGGVGERPWCYTSSTQTRWEYCDIPKCEVCTRYDQAFCSQLPGYSPSDKSLIYVDRQSRGPGAMHTIELDMMESYKKLIDNQLIWSPGCDLALKQLLCHTAFPFCSSNQAPEAKTTCSDHCQLLQVVELCSDKVYEHLLRDNKLSMPDCSASAKNSMTATGPSCMPVIFSHTIEDHHRHVDCYNTSDLGQSYTGRRAFTQSGEACDSWSNTHLLFNASLYPELNGAENFCRNPGRLREKPWCFTSRDSWNYCDLPANCTDIPAGVRSAARRHSSGNQTLYPVLFTVIGVIVVVVVIVSAVVIGRYMNRKSKLARTIPPLPLSLQHTKKYPSDMKMIDNDNYVPLPNSKMAATIKKFQELDRQMKKANIRYTREIGRGNFGVVFQGKVSNLHDIDADAADTAEEETLVAVKTLKDDCQEALEDFAREAKIMLQFDHPNIIKLYGVCTDDMPYYLVFEYMDQGDLATFLRKNASSEQRRLMSTSSRHRSRTDSTISDDPASLSVDQLTDMCKQIAKGMDYLAGKDHVHRDLACRNCLVKTCFDTGLTDSGYIIKIGDFGMSHDLYQRNYYRVQGQAVLPVRWMSPEAVIYGKFSSAGDVWSFGVTMWEIFSFAMQPYYGISNEEVTKFIRTGRYLEKPFYCPRNTYEIMKQCWSAEPSQRPLFCDLHTMLAEHRMSVSSDESSLYSDTMSQTGSELDSDAFLEENSIDGVFVAMSGESQA